MKYVTRINSSLRFDSNLLNTFRSIGSIEGVDYVDLNYPEHFADHDIEVIEAEMEECGLKCNAINLRLRDKYIEGEFGNHEPAISQDAITLCREAVDACRKLGRGQMIMWLGFDGLDYPFQVDYVSYWNRIVKALRDVCDYSKVPVNIEYKFYEERVHAFIDSFGAVVSILHDVDRENLGVTLDFCHMSVKKENPAFAAAWLLERRELYNIHLNDGEGSTDDGLMMGTANFWKIVKVMYRLKKYDFQGVIYFDTFSKREKAMEECEADIRICRRVEWPIDAYGLCRMEKVAEQNDVVTASNMMVVLLQTKTILMQKEKRR